MVRTCIDSGKWDKAYRRFTDKKKGVPWDAKGASLELVKFVETANMEKGCNILDVGCGTGINTAYLASEGFNVTGIDSSPTAISMAIDIKKKKKNLCEFLVADVLDLPFDADTFGVVYDRGCFHSLRHFEREAYIENIKRVLKNDGLLLLSCCSRSNCRNRWRRIYLFFKKLAYIIKGEHLRKVFLSEKTLRDMFSSDFEVLSISEMPVLFANHKPRLFTTCLLKKIGSGRAEENGENSA